MVPAVKQKPSQAEFQTAIAARANRWYSACLRITRNPQLAEDAVQDALLNAWKNRHQFQQDAKLETWIHSICVNSALSLLRKQRPGTFDSLDSEPEDPSASTEQSHYHGELKAELDRAVKQLWQEDRINPIMAKYGVFSLKPESL